MVHARVLRRLRSTAITALVVAAPLVAAPPLAAQTSFGVLLGGVASNLSGVDLSADDLFGGRSQLKDRLGFQAGIYVKRALNTTWSLQPELHYTQKGATFENGDNSSVVGSMHVDLGYIEVPVLLRADFGQGRIHPFVVAGPTIAMRLACDVTLSASNASLTRTCEQFDDGSAGATDPFKKSDVGGIVGIGLVGRAIGREVSAQVRYGRGFTSVVADDASTTQTAKNRVLSVVFALGR